MKKLSRRDFLKLCALGGVGTAFRPFFGVSDQVDGGDHMVRVAVRQVSIYSKPSDKSKILFQRYRDDLLYVYEEVVSDDGPTWNPIWYRVWGGWLHRAYVETVKVVLNTPVDKIAEPTGWPFEVTVPYTPSYFYSKKYGWRPNYRLYYGSIHWIVGVEAGPDGEPWYKIEAPNDIMTNFAYFAPAIHLRPFTREDLSPIHTDIEYKDKKIEISIVNQELTAFEKGKEILKTKVSTGLLHPARPGMIPLATPLGDWTVVSKTPSKHMGNGILTDNMEEYVLPGVPWTMFFQWDIGAAIHGCYWHTNYGIPMSHACVNMRNEDAHFLYQWTEPRPDPTKWMVKGFGTQVKVY